MTSTAIFWPAIVLALVTLGLFAPMVTSRIRAVKAGQAKPRDFKLRTHEPDASRPWVNALTNQFETPVLFYAVVLMAFVTAQGDGWMVGLAWIYAVAKIAQTAILVTSNNLYWRMRIFGISLLALTVMWLLFAIRLLVA